MQLDVILDTRARPDELAELGRLAERFGLGGVWVSSLLDSRDPFTNLVMLAQTTKRISLGPIAVNPDDTHRAHRLGLHTLNEIAGARLIVIGGGGGAAGAGDQRRGGARGAERGDHPRRRQQRTCLGRGRNVQRARPAVPAEAPPPALYVGASQAQMLRMAAGWPTAS